MATSREIKCVNKIERSNIHERITNVGGTYSDNTRWKISQREAIKGINDGNWSFYVTKNGKSVAVIVATSQYGYEYLKTEADSTESNNLLNLPECT